MVDGLLARFVSVDKNPFHPSNFSIELLRYLKRNAFKTCNNQLNSQLCQFLKLFPTVSQFGNVFEKSNELEYQELLVEFHRSFSIARLENESTDPELKKTLHSSFMSKIDYCLSVLFSGHLSSLVDLRDFSLNEMATGKQVGSDSVY